MSTIVREQIEGLSAWRGPQLDPERWQIRLTDAEIEELDGAMRAVLELGKAWGAFEREDFPLPLVAARLREIERELRHGLGFVLLRGIPVQRYSLDEIKTIYWGIGTHLGTAVTQNAKRELIGHIENINPTGTDNPNFRTYQGTVGLEPHSDYVDIVGLLCVSQAATGGLSTITSSTAVYNRILRDHPELVEMLYEGFYHALRGEGPTGDPRETAPAPVPIYHWHNGRLWCWYHTRILRLGLIYRGVEVTPKHEQLFACVQRLCLDPELRLDMSLEPGDIQLINNYATLHARSQYEDDAEHHRLLLRIWLNLRGEDQLDTEIARWIRRGIPGKTQA